MDFELRDTPEMEEFRKEVRAYLGGIIPENLVASPAHPQDAITNEQKEVKRQIQLKLGAKGWLSPRFPKEYGGGGLSMDQTIVLSEEVSGYGLDLATDSMFGANIQVWGTEEQKHHFLPPILMGTKVTWLLMTEPHGGSDLASTKTVAIRDGDEYVLNGTKTFVGDDSKPDQFWTIVLTDPNGPRHQNLSWIIVPADSPGITIQPLDLMTAGTVIPEGHKNSVFFEDVRVPAFNLIGGENNGWKVASTHLELEHGGSGRISKNRHLERFFEYCGSTAFNGQPIIRDPDVRELAADVQIQGDIHRLFDTRNFWIRHARKTGSYEGPQSVFFRRTSDMRNGHSIQQALGYLSITNDPQWGAAGGWMELYMRQGPRGYHGGGTGDIDRVIVARRMGLGRTVKEAAGRLE